MSVKVKFIRDDNAEFVIDNSLWKIPSDGLTGFDFTGIAITTENNAISDGSYLTSKRIPEKDRTIKAILQNKSMNKTMRQIVRGFFNMKHTFSVYITYQGITRWCKGELYSVSLPTDNIYNRLKLDVTILSPMPFMLSEDNYAQNIALIEPLFEFPYNKKIGELWEFSRFKFANSVELINDGDVETYCKAVMTAKGSVTNPKLIKGDKFIKILDTLETGDVVIIDLENQPVSITKNGVNIIGKTDRTSSFNDMVFNVGSNMIGYDADDGSNMLDVTIYFNKRYLGI